jgi:hypothetical protein
LRFSEERLVVFDTVSGRALHSELFERADGTNDQLRRERLAEGVRHG